MQEHKVVGEIDAKNSRYHSVVFTIAVGCCNDMSLAITFLDGLLGCFKCTYCLFSMHVSLQCPVSDRSQITNLTRDVCLHRSMQRILPAVKHRPSWVVEVLLV
jgi:hypothetical protein